MSDSFADQLYGALNSFYRKEGEEMGSNNLIGRWVRFNGREETGVILAVWSHELTLMVAVDVKGDLETWSIGEAPFKLVPVEDEERLD